ncbi:hypothetical protein TELCIR_00375 [Teladorsagia circumcincta]|uniref:Uncharacterized protein n=1 Tax=Teladorsagia circumcincta TaxID=45464 RepID=A0A2G9V4S1_TELCI|nr:hypothetical protein TELCIR_00375 [Teladorsagia circumcincta]
MCICLGAVWLAILCQYVSSMGSETTALVSYQTPPPPQERPPTGLVIRAKRQWGGFGCCPMMPPMCCPMPMPMTALVSYQTPPPPQERPPTGLVIRAKRQWGGFGCCPMMPPMCCPMPMPMDRILYHREKVKYSSYTHNMYCSAFLENR